MHTLTLKQNFDYSFNDDNLTYKERMTAMFCNFILMFLF